VQEFLSSCWALMGRGECLILYHGFERTKRWCVKSALIPRWNRSLFADRKGPQQDQCNVGHRNLERRGSNDRWHDMATSL